MTQNPINLVNRIPDPEFLYKGEADAAYGPAVVAPAQLLVFEREMAEVSEKMILEVMALFDDHEIELDHSEESFEELDKLMDQNWPNPIEDEEVLEAIVANWGAYLGVSIVENIGGTWTFRKDLEHASIYFPRLDLEAFPLHVIKQRFQLGGRGQQTLATFYGALVAKLTA